MSKITCPTDFSTTADNAVNYAAQLAAKNKTEFEILHIQLLSSLHPIVSGIIAKQNTLPVSDSLQKLCAGVSENYDIRCSYTVETTDNSLEAAITSKSGKSNLIVMGTNGMDDLFQYIFGTNTFSVITKSKCPVLMIPEGVAYKPVKKIIFAWDYGKAGKDSILQLKDIFSADHPEIIFLHISKEKTEVGDEVFKALKEEMYAFLGEDSRISFQRIFSDDPENFAEKIAEYADEEKADMLAITYQDRGVIRNIFHGKITKELTEMAHFPLLALHA